MIKWKTQGCSEEAATLFCVTFWAGLHLKGVESRLIDQFGALTESLKGTTEESVEPEPIVWEPRRGDICPICGRGRLDYDGLLNLACSECGYALGGCFT